MSKIPQEAIELLPCPFCGEQAERIDIDDGDNAGGSFICCTACQASGNIEFGYKENFVSNWNRRADAGRERVLEEAIREAIDLLMCRKLGSHARSPEHNARLKLQAALAGKAPSQTDRAEGGV